jgi:hypothetical protein
MRVVMLVLGFVLGVTATLAYAIFANPPRASIATRPIPEDAPITVTLGAPFLDAILRRAAIAAPVALARPSDLHVELRDDAIVVHATVDVLGRITRGSAVLRPVLREGRLRVDVVETNLGALPLPALERLIEEQVNARIRSLLSGMPITFTGASVDRERGLVVTCRIDLGESDRSSARHSSAPTLQSADEKRHGPAARSLQQTTSNQEE